MFCLERIPGSAATPAIMKAFPDVSDGFKPRILAALIGLGKANTPQAAALIFTKLHSDHRTVRITAGHVWASIPKNS